MKKVILNSSLALALVCSGCMSWQVPRTTISGSIGGRPFALSSPKDSTLTGLDIKAETNGAVSIHVTSLVTVMNPAVITMTGNAEAQVISAVAQGVSSALGTAAGSAAAASVGK